VPYSPETGLDLGRNNSDADNAVPDATDTIL
jgi:hypothetical protein